MKRKALQTILALALCTFAVGLVGCGQGSDKTNGGSQVESNEAAQEKEFSKSFTLLFNDDEELVEHVPVAPISSPYAESMMQVTGYNYKLIPADDSKYEFIVELTCGSDAADSDMYMKRVMTYTGTYTVDGEVYTLEKPTNLEFTQETAGQFAATSGQGGADYWGPNGLSFNETFKNEEAYAGVKTGADMLADMEGCKVTVDGSKIVSFEALGN